MLQFLIDRWYLLAIQAVFGLLAYYLMQRNSH